MNVEREKLKKNILRKKVLVCLKGLKGAPLNTKNFHKMFLIFFFNIYEKCIWYQFKILFQTYARNKKKENFDRKVFKLQRFSKILPNVGRNALLWGGGGSLIQKPT